MSGACNVNRTRAVVAGTGIDALNGEPLQTLYGAGTKFEVRLSIDKLDYLVKLKEAVTRFKEGLFIGIAE